MKTVLHIRIDAPTYCSDGIMKGFIDNGFEYECISYQGVLFSNGLHYLQSLILHRAIELKPDLIFLHIQKDGVLTVDLAQQLQKIGKVVNFTFDIRVPEKTQWMYDLAKYISLTCFACDEDVKECQIRGIYNVACIQSACDINFYKPKLITEVSEVPEIVFIGNNYVGTNLDFPLAQERQDMIEFLYAEYGSRFEAYGLGQRNKMVTAEQELNLYNNASIVVCQNNFDRTNYQSDRVWKAMSSGTFTLIKSAKGVGEMFSIENHLDIWTDLQDLKRKIDYYLDNQEERQAIAKMGCQYVRENHTWKHRVKQIIQLL